MKRLFAVMALLVLAGCDNGLTERERECMELTGDAMCISEVRSGNVSLAKAQNTEVEIEYDNVVQPGNYTNYYGSPQHGYWSNGTYHFNDPYSHAATSTNAFLIGAGLGGLTAYALTKAASRSSWNSSHPGGYKPTTTSVTKYTSKSGYISKEEYNRRMAQSKRDRKKHTDKLKAETKKVKEEAAKANGQKIAAEKKLAASKKPTASKPKPKSKPLSFTKPKPKPVKKPKPAKKPKKRKAKKSKKRK